MATKISEISDLIVAKLEAIVDDSMVRIIPEVRDYASSAKGKYPLAEVLPTGGATTRRIDTGRNERVFAFRVNLYQEQSEAGKSPQASTDALKTACDAVLEAFDTDKDFNFEISNVIISSMTFDYVQNAGVKLFATFNVECAIIVPNV